MFGQNQISVGRKKGATAKHSKTVKRAIANIVADNVNQIRIDLMELEPKDRINALIQLSKFVIPTLKTVDMETNINESSMTIIDAIMNTDEQLIESHINTVKTANNDD